MVESLSPPDGQLQHSPALPLNETSSLDPHRVTEPAPLSESIRLPSLSGPEGLAGMSTAEIRIASFSKTFSSRTESSCTTRNSIAPLRAVSSLVRDRLSFWRRQNSRRILLRKEGNSESSTREVRELRALMEGAFGWRHGTPFMSGVAAGTSDSRAKMEKSRRCLTLEDILPGDVFAVRPVSR